MITRYDHLFTHVCFFVCLFVFSQILGGDKAFLCCAARDPKTRKKGMCVFKYLPFVFIVLNKQLAISKLYIVFALIFLPPSPRFKLITFAQPLDPVQREGVMDCYHSFHLSGVLPGESHCCLVCVFTFLLCF